MPKDLKLDLTSDEIALVARAVEDKHRTICNMLNKYDDITLVSSLKADQLRYKELMQKIDLAYEFAEER